MWLGNFVPIIVSALVILVHSLPSSIGREAFQYDLSSINENEKILKLFLQLATHTVNRLTRLRKEADKDHNCSRHNNSSPVSTTEIIMTQLSSQEGLERPFQHQDQGGLTFDDFKKNNNDRLPLENLNQNQIASRQPSDIEENVARNSSSKTNNQIRKNLQDTKNTSSLPQNLAMDGISVRLFNPVNLSKSVLNAGSVDDLSENVGKFNPGSQDLRQPKLEMKQRLHDTHNLIENTSDMKIINDLRENANNRTPWSQDTEKSSDEVSDVSQRFFDPTSLIITLLGAALSQQTTTNLPIVGQITSNIKSIQDSVMSFLPGSRKSEDNIRGDNVTSSVISNLLPTINLLIQQAHSFQTVREEQINPDANNILDTVGASNINTNTNLSEVAHVISDINNRDLINNESVMNVQTSPATNILPEISRNHARSQVMTGSKDNTKQFVGNAKNNTDQAVRKFEGNDQERGNNNSPKNIDNTKTHTSNDQSMSAPTINQENIPIPLFRLLSDFNEHKNNDERARNSLSLPRTNEKINNLSSEKSDLEKQKFQLQNNLSARWKQGETSLPTSHNNNDEISGTIGDRNNRAKDNLSRLDSYSRFIDNLGQNENLHEQLETELQEISGQLIDALTPIMEKEMINNENHASN